MVGLLRRVAGEAAHPAQPTGEVHDHLDAGGSLDGAEDQRQIEPTIHQVLAAAGDDRAAAWLALAHTRLQAMAATIADPARRSRFLAGIPAHREIEALVQRR